MESMSEQQRYRIQQEEFVSNHGGSSPLEILLLMLPNILAISLTHFVLLKYGRKLPRNIQTFVEFVLNVVPCVLCCTILSEYTIPVSMVMLTASVLFSQNIHLAPKTIRTERSTKRIPFLTHFRALTNIITAICILGVDFRVFPRKFAKTEVYGYSLMDTGVGLFVMANALVAPEARDFLDIPRTNLMRRFSENARVCIRGSAPLLVLGFGRFLAVEYSGYQKHVSEYGVHWNFFVTLAFVKIFTSTISSAISSKFAGLTGLWIIGMHEYALSTNGLKEWVLGNTPRVDFVSANREGLVSVPGYVGLYLIGIAVGRVVHMTFNSARRHALVTRFKVHGVEFVCSKFHLILVSKLLIMACMSWGVTFFCDSRFGVSRRLTNAGYCFWIVALSTTVLDGLLLVDIQMDIVRQIVGGKKRSSRSESKRVTFEDGDSEGEVVRITPEIFEAVNYNGLVFFLLANLVTGVVNMSMRTLYVEGLQALQVIIAYIATVIGVSVILYRRKIQVKL
ncbi:GPI-anchored wall transfer protein 1 [Diachasma alloeum]|uniref:GPI-anchored wall transfer protein 1 n=1 Tax=Diachasma alloeum TaxID=454923 RepID=UPI0007384228|nr:GPI-anchored wall transfer protein 1 [Diachasma alloeum]